jgi:glycosyltransferase involved in cell wall biosynthesis
VRIAVDARVLANPLTGIGRYTYELLEQMISQGHHWFLYSDRPLQVKLPSNPRVSVRHGRASARSVTGLYWSQWHYRRWARQDVVDLFWSPRHHLPLFLPRHISRVVTIHDLVWKKFPETMPLKSLWLERLLMGPSVRSSDRVICVSKFTASEVSRHYPMAIGKCQVIYEAAANSIPYEPPPPKMPAGYLLFVGTLEPRKNLPRLLRAYARLVTGGSVPPLVLVGGKGWGDSSLMPLIEELQLQDKVVVRGYVSDAELQSLYMGARCLLMPSLYEGFGLPLVEAMRAGVPAISSSTSALPEVVGDAGLLVNPYSEPDIADAMLRMIKDDGLHRQLAEKALQRSKLFSWQRAARETLDLFKQTLANHKPQAFRNRVAEKRLG